MSVNVEPTIVHVLNIPRGVRWRQVKAELLVASGIPEDAILHIQVLDRSCVVTLNSRLIAEKLVELLDGAQYQGLILSVQFEDQLQQFQVPQLIYPIYSMPPPHPGMQQQLMHSPEYYPVYPMSMGPGPPLPPPPHSQLQQGPPPLFPPPSLSATSNLTSSSANSPYTYRPPMLNYRQIIQPQHQQYPQLPPSTPLSSNYTPSPSISPRLINSLRQYPYQKITDVGPVPDRKRLFIGNIPYTTQWKDLKDYLRLAGDIMRVEIPGEPDGSSKGFAIATYANEWDSLNAIEKLDGELFQGRKLTVRFDRFPTRDRYEKISSQNTGNENPKVENSVSGTYLKITDNGDEVNSNKEVEKSLDEVIKKIDSSVKNRKNNSINDTEEIPKEDEKRFEDEARNLIESLTLE